MSSAAELLMCFCDACDLPWVQTLVSMWNCEGGQWEETALVEKLINCFLYELKSPRSAPWVCTLLFSLIQMSNFSMLSAVSSPMEPRALEKPCEWMDGPSLHPCLDASFFPAGRTIQHGLST